MLNITELVLLSFAAYRVTRLVVRDSILDGWRARLELWHAKRFESKVRIFIRELLGCQYCVSFHAAWLTVLVYLLVTGKGSASFTGFMLFGILAFAVAGASALLSRYDDSP
jgi:hypothetical protein